MERKCNKFANRRYRHGFVRAAIETRIPVAIRQNRKARRWSQGKLAKKMKKPQSVINRAENTRASAMTIKSLLSYAKAFDCALAIQFIGFDDFIKGNQIPNPVKPYRPIPTTKGSA